MTEIELKFLLDEAGERRLRRAAPLREAPKEKARRLLTVYMDTAEGALAGQGIALRLRREGRTWTQTVKAARAIRGGLSTAQEVNVAAPGGRVDLAAIPDARLRGAIERAVGDLPLAPVAETDMQRTTWRVAHAGAEIELALDRGEIRAGGRAEPFREAELELLSGEPAALFELARALFPSGGLAFSTLNKAARAGRLATGQPIVEHGSPRTARAVRLEPGTPAETAARDVLAECLDQVAANVAVVRASDDPEGPHQLRVGLRRLRTAFGLFRGPLAGPALEHLSAEARWLGQEVGRLRDLDVARIDLADPLAGTTPAEPGFPALSKALAEAADAERARLRETLEGTRVHAFLLDLAEFVALRGWLDPADHAQTARLAEPVEALAVRALDKAEARVAKRARGLRELDIEARHELRKALKKLRYAIEFMGPLYPAPEIRALLKPLKALQRVFGDLNDAAMAEALFLSPGGPGRDDPDAARAAGRIIGRANAEAEHAWAEVEARWAALSAAPRPWAPPKTLKPRKKAKKRG